MPIETDVDRALQLTAIIEQACRESALAVVAYAQRVQAQPDVHELEALSLDAAATAAARLIALGPLRDGEVTWFVRGLLVNAFLGMFEAASTAARAAILLTPPAAEPASARRSGRARAMLRRYLGPKVERLGRMTRI